MSAVVGVAFDREGKQLVTGAADGTARVWDRNGSLRFELKGPSATFTQLAFASDGSKVLTVSQSRVATVWKLPPTGVAAPGVHPVPTTLTGHFGPVVRATFDPAGRLVAAASADGTARIWNADDGRAIAVLNGHIGRVRDVAFSPDGRRVATAGHDRTVRVWQTDGGVEAIVLRGHEQPIVSVTFSPDGKRVLSTSDDSTTRLWRVDLGDLLSLLRSAHSTVCLEAQERVRFLRESAEEAAAALLACEARHGR